MLNEYNPIRIRETERCPKDLEVVVLSSETVWKYTLEGV